MTTNGRFKIALPGKLRLREEAMPPLPPGPVKFEPYDEVDLAVAEFLGRSLDGEA